MEDCEAPARYENGRIEVYSEVYPIQVRQCSPGLVQAPNSLENGEPSDGSSATGDREDLALHNNSGLVACGRVPGGPVSPPALYLPKKKTIQWASTTTEKANIGT